MLKSGSNGLSLMSFWSNNLEDYFVKVTLISIYRVEKLSGKNTGIVV